MAVHKWIIFFLILVLDLIDEHDNVSGKVVTSKSNGRPAIDVTLNTKQGRVTGLVEHYGGDISYTKFLGIPYALAPVGSARFTRPKKHPGWSHQDEPWNGSFYRPFCVANSPNAYPYHPVHSESFYRTSEDCLYINIYIPRNLSSTRDVQSLGLPVLLHLHGYTERDGVDRVDNNWPLAGAGDVIVVQVNYRVGVFGFLSLDDDSAPGNVGLLDQRMAMHWVWDNIGAFGGNSQRITLLGAGTVSRDPSASA